MPHPVNLCLFGILLSCLNRSHAVLVFITAIEEGFACKTAGAVYAVYVLRGVSYKLVRVFKAQIVYVVGKDLAGKIFKTAAEIRQRIAEFCRNSVGGYAFAAVFFDIYDNVGKS